MKSCTRCGNMLADNATYCNVCNSPQTEGFEEFEQRPQYSDTFLKVLCILTIVGAGISLISSLVSLTRDAVLPIPGLKLITVLSILIVISKLIGAVFMLQKKLTGLFIYTVAAIAAIFLQIYSVYVTSNYMENLMAGSNTIIIITAVVTVLFFIAYIIMYWLPVNRRLLS